MSEQVMIQFRTDKNLKREATELYEALGMDLPTALRIFMTKSIQERGLPFSVTLSEKAAAGMKAKQAFHALRQQSAELPEMSLDEINAEIDAARRARRADG